IKARIELGAAADGGGSARRLVIRKVRVPAPGGTNGNPGKITSFTKPVLNPVNTFPDGIIGGVPFTWPTNGIPLLMFKAGLGCGGAVGTNPSVPPDRGRVRWRVMFGFRKTDRFTGAAAAGLPPVQTSKMSLTSSAFPSARTIGGAAALTLQVTVGTWA